GAFASAGAEALLSACSAAGAPVDAGSAPALPFAVAVAPPALGPTEEPALAVACAAVLPSAAGAAALPPAGGVASPVVVPPAGGAALPVVAALAAASF